MRRGIGALFVAFLAVRVMTAPPSTTTAPTAPTSAPVGGMKAIAPRTPGRSRTAASEDQTSIAKNGSLPTASDPCEAKSEKCPKKGLLQTLEGSLAATKPDADLIKRVTEFAPNAANAHFLIATVPDPVHTHLSLLFDRQIVAIEEAVQQGGYLFSRAYLPWDNQPHLEDTDFRLRLKEEDYKDLREDYPGLLVFHARESLETPTTNPSAMTTFESRDTAPSKPADTATQKPGPLLVFLVAETPTGGIDKDQFDNALVVIAKFDAGRSSPSSRKPGELYILGPTFSGSLYSLRDILEQNASQFSSIVIHSGTATDNGTITWFQGPRAFSHPLPITFRTFEEGNDYALDHFLSFACRQGYRADQIAVLSEDETAYGAGRNDQTAEAANMQTCPDDPNRQAIHIFFPRDISALRNAYQQDLKSSGNANSSAAPRSTLSLNLEDHGNNDDTVAEFSPDQTPLSEEGVMMGIVSDLRDHRSNLVVIEATNPLDIVFLVRYLRTAYSDARIVTLGSDLLLPRQVDDPRLRGVMQVSSYSLIPEIDRYTITTKLFSQPRYLNRIFPSDYSVGTFNAALSLLAVQAGLNEPRSSPAISLEARDGNHIPGLPAGAYAQYGWPMLAGSPGSGESILAPPLWLTIEGRDQFWPVELLDDVREREREKPADPNSEPATLLEAIRSTPAEPEPSRQEPQLPPSWSILCVLGIGFAVIHAVLVQFGSVMSASAFRANFAHVNDPWRNVTLLICAVVIFDILLCLLWPEYRFRGPWRSFFLAFAVLVYAAILIDLWSRGKWALVIWWLPLAILSCAALALLALAQRPNLGPMQHFMGYRYIHIGSGVSPAAPLLLLFAGCLWACWYSLSGRSPWDLTGRGPQLPALDDVMQPSDFTSTVDSPADRRRLAALTEERNPGLLEAMKPGKLNLRILIPSLFVSMILVFGGIIPIPHRIQSFEGPGFDRVYTFFVALIVFVLLSDTFCLGLIWLELRRLLMTLDRLPLRRGFARMTGITSKRLWQLGGNTYEDYFTVLAKEFHTLTAMVNLIPSYSKVSDELRNVSAEVAQFAWWTQESPASLREDNRLCQNLRNLQDELAGTCAAVLRELNELWDRETRPVWDAENIARQKAKNEAPSPDDEEAGAVPLGVRLAEDFVCLFYLNFISSVFTRMRSLVLTVAGLYVFLLLSFGSYPFEPSSVFHTAMTFLLILIAVVVGIVYGQAHKNATLSWITDTVPGELGVEFWFRLAAVISVPLLSFLAVKFPELSGFLFSWLAPASQAFR